MQSFLQYHRFNKHATAQYERDQEKALAANQHDQSSGQTSQATSPSSTSSGTLPTVPVSEPIPRDGDLEKANSRNSHISETHEETLASSGPDDVCRQEGRPDRLEQAPTTRSHASTGTNIGRAMTGIVVRTRTTGEGGGESGKVFVVGYEGEDDIMNPHNWSRLTRWRAT